MCTSRPQLPSGKRYTMLQKRFQPKEICMQEKKKKIKSTQKGNRNQKNLSKITHTDKNKTSINRTYCIMPFSWLEEKFKRFRFSSASSCREPEPRILNSMGGCVSATTQPRPCLPYKAQDKINPHIQKELATPLSLGNKL